MGVGVSVGVGEGVAVGAGVKVGVKVGDGSGVLAGLIGRRLHADANDANAIKNAPMLATRLKVILVWNPQPIHLPGRKKLRESIHQRFACQIAQMAGVNIAGRMLDVVRSSQKRRAALEQGADNWM